MRNKKLLTAVACLAGTAIASQAAILVAGWEDFTGTTGFTPTQKDANTTASVVATATSGAWGQWFNSGQSSSADGTFGSFADATANTSLTSGAGLTLNNSDGVLTFTLTNDSGLDRDMDGFHFDGVHKFGGSADTWGLAFGGAIAGTAITGQTVDQVNGGMAAATVAERDTTVNLSTALSDSVWEAGQDITFTLTFTGSGNDGPISNGNELILDNIGVSVVAVPEPSTLALLGMSGLGIFLLRRKIRA